MNCGAIPANLLESELFGHMRGAFTGADRDKKGLFREAEGGTMLLDEIGEMPLKMQTSLLRALQERTVRPRRRREGGAGRRARHRRDEPRSRAMVGRGRSAKTCSTASTSSSCKIPPLRDRSDDIPPLIDHFLTIFAARHRRDEKSDRRATRSGSSSPTSGPGNVRQLEHVLLNAWLMSEESEITALDLTIPDSRGTASPPANPSISETLPRPRGSTRPQTESQFRSTERDKILHARSASSNWNRAQAAKLVGLPRRTFYRRLKEYGILRVSARLRAH